MRKEITYIEKENGCWECNSHATNKSGYPVTVIKGKQITISRYAYITHNSLEGLSSTIVVRHICDNPKCINPSHLISGSHLDNVKDRVERNRSAKGKDNGQTKLNEDQVKYIKYMSRGMSNKKLSIIFNVSEKCIYQIKKNISWKYI